jgi:two-component system, OmpR family, phosphate regulon sensor histidine kinase PhoR
MWLPWALAGLLAIITLTLAWRLARANSSQAAAEQSLADASRLLEHLSLTSEWYAAQIQAILQARLEPFLLVSADRTVADMNPAARLLFPPPADIGQTLIMATRSVDLDALAEHCLAGGADLDRQVLIGRNQQPYRARAVLASSPGGGEQYRGVALWLQDLSELQRLGRSRRDFVANISHELRTPITSIRLLVDTLRGTAPVDAAARDELLEKISVETEALAQLAQELLDLAQIESGQTLVRMVAAPVADLVSGVTARLGPQAERKHQTVRVDVPDGLVALADTDQVTRALGNLVHNAIKFTPEGGQVWVTGSRLDGDIVLEVGDTGRGIPSEDLPRVFERFFRGDRSRASGGTGLGLAIAKHVVEAHGGRIWVASDGRSGHGAVFRFTLPAADDRP